MEEILHSEGVPHCPCGGIIKPDVVLYGEPLDPQITQAAQEAIDRADLLLIGGVSGGVVCGGLSRPHRDAQSHTHGHGSPGQPASYRAHRGNVGRTHGHFIRLLY